jgi:hypothetical protein
MISRIRSVSNRWLRNLNSSSMLGLVYSSRQGGPLLLLLLLLLRGRIGRECRRALGIEVMLRPLIRSIQIIIPETARRGAWWRARRTAGADPVVVSVAIVGITAAASVVVTAGARAVVGIRGIVPAHPAWDSRSETRNGWVFGWRGEELGRECAVVAFNVDVHLVL